VTEAPCLARDGPEGFSAEEVEAFIQAIATDYVAFVRAIWQALRYDTRYPLGEMEEDICRFVADTAHRRRVILAHRSSGKTHWGSACYSMFRLFQDPDAKILVVSKSGGHAVNIVQFIRQCIGSIWFLNHLNPEHEDKQDQTKQFHVAGSEMGINPSLRAVGIEGQITGGRASLIIADDVETPENTKTIPARAALAEKVKEFFNIATFGDKEIVYFGTYHHEESLYLKLPERGYTVRTWPFTYPHPEEKFLGLAPIIGRKLADGTGKPGEPTYSHRYTKKDVAEAIGELGTLGFQMHYQLVCNLGETHAYPIKLRDLIVMEVQRDKAPISIAWGMTNDRGGTTAIEGLESLGLEGDQQFYRPIFYDREWQPYTGTKAYIDPAGKGSDLTGVAIVSHLAGIMWVKAVRGFPGGASSERIAEIVELLREHGVRDCYYESNIDTFDSYRSALEVELSRHFLEPGEDERFPEGWRCSLEARRATSRMHKEAKIITCLEPVISAHRMVVDPEVLRPEPGRKQEHEIQYMLSRIQNVPKCLREDGPIDALAGCVAEWQNTLRTDPRKATSMARTRAFQEALKEHLLATGQPVREPRWFSNAR